MKEKGNKVKGLWDKIDASTKYGLTWDDITHPKAFDLSGERVGILCNVRTLAILQESLQIGIDEFLEKLQVGSALDVQYKAVLLSCLIESYLYAQSEGKLVEGEKERYEKILSLPMEKANILFLLSAFHFLYEVDKGGSSATLFAGEGEKKKTARV